MEQKDQKNQEKNLSELMEFDFDDILTDDLPEDHSAQNAKKDEVKKKAAQPQKKPIPDEAAIKKAKQAKKARRRRGWKITFDIATWLKDLAIAAVVLWFLITFVASFVTMPDSSMEPSLEEGERFIISKLVYRFKEPDRGDVIAFEYEDESGQTQLTVSRVIGVPGDTINIDELGKIKVNGKTLKTSYCDGKTIFVPNQTEFPYTVPDGYYFLLSDNPSSTTDSRFNRIGAISESDIVGRVFFCYWPKESWRPIG